jgi:hypothetical protein
MDARVEVNGETVRAVVEGMGTMKSLSLRVLKKQGIDEPQPGKWYPQQAWLKAFEEISRDIGPNTLFRIGESIPRSANFPPEINTIERALAAIDVAYHMNHRIGTAILFNPSTGVMGEGIGHYTCEPAGPPSVRLVCANPYPCDFDRGIVDAMAKRFKPADSARVVVQHEGPCRAKGAEKCVYLVTW